LRSSPAHLCQPSLGVRAQNVVLDDQGGEHAVDAVEAQIAGAELRREREQAAFRPQETKADYLAARLVAVREKLPGLVEKYNEAASGVEIARSALEAAFVRFVVVALISAIRSGQNAKWLGRSWHVRLRLRTAPRPERSCAQSFATCSRLPSTRQA
jgi:hypothetical protein